MTLEQTEKILSTIKAILPSVRWEADTPKMWQLVLGREDFDRVMAATIRLLRTQQARSLPTVGAILAEMGGPSPDGISPAAPAYRGGCSNPDCRNGLIVAPDKHGYEYAYRCHCPAGKNRPEKGIPLAPHWVMKGPPPDRKTLAAGDVHKPWQVTITEVAEALDMPKPPLEVDLGVPF